MAMAVSTIRNPSLLTTSASYSITTAFTVGAATSTGPSTQKTPVAMWCTSGSVVRPSAHPSALLPPAVANSVSRSPRALQSCSTKLREVSQGFGHGVRVFPALAVRKTRLGAVRGMAQGTPGAGQLEDLIKSKNNLNPVVVYSKTWCP